MSRGPSSARRRGIGRSLALGMLAGSCALACGYRFTVGGGEGPGGARTLFVPVFRNHTAEPGVEGAFTEAFRQELARWGREGGEASDAVVEGEIASITGGPAIVTSLFSDAGAARTSLASYRVQATVVLRVVKAGRTVAETSVSGGEDYLPSRGEGTAPATAVLEAEANRRLALRRLAESLMRQAYANLTGF